MSVWCQFVVDGLWNTKVCFQPPSSLIGNVLSLAMPFCVWPTPNRMLWRLGERIELVRSTSVTLLTGSPSGDPLQTLFCGRWRFCAVCSDTVSYKSVKVRCGGWFRSKLERQERSDGRIVSVVPGVPQWSVLGIQLLLFTSQRFYPYWEYGLRLCSCWWESSSCWIHESRSQEN